MLKGTAGMEEWSADSAVSGRIDVVDPFSFQLARQREYIRERGPSDDRAVVGQTFLRDANLFHGNRYAPTATRTRKRRLFIRSSPSNVSLARVKLQGLSKAYDGAPPVTELDLEVQNKEFVVLLGPSGC